MAPFLRSADVEGKNDTKRSTTMYGCFSAPQESEAAMCSVGGPFGDAEIVWPKNYRCSTCGKKFKAVGEDPECPSCQSNDLEELPED